MSAGQHFPGRDQGQMEIHGAKRLRTWTKLNETAVPGQNYIITSEPVDYADGETVILTGNEVPGMRSDLCMCLCDDLVLDCMCFVSNMSHFVSNKYVVLCKP